jgi:hypothetical protein
MKPPIHVLASVELAGAFEFLERTGDALQSAINRGDDALPTGLDRAECYALREVSRLLIAAIRNGSDPIRVPCCQLACMGQIEKAGEDTPDAELRQAAAGFGFAAASLEAAADRLGDDTPLAGRTIAAAYLCHFLESMIGCAVRPGWSHRDRDRFFGLN